MKASKFILVMLCLLLTACSNAGGTHVELLPSGKILRASGYSHFDDTDTLGVHQRWLKAQQAAKIQAFRDLAALLYQERLSDQTTVAEQVMRDEGYRIYVDSFLREAKASDYRTINNSLKASLELPLTSRFYQCMAGNAQQVGQCLLEDNKSTFTRLGYKPATMTSANFACGMRDCSDQLHVQGFAKQPNELNNLLLDVGLYDAEWIANTGARTLLNYLLINGFLNAL